MRLASYFRISAVVVAAALLAVVMWHASPASAIGTKAVPGEDHSPHERKPCHKRHPRSH